MPDRQFDRRLRLAFIGCSAGVAGVVRRRHREGPTTDDDGLPDDIGPGWEIVTGEFCQLQPPWVQRCFEGASGYLVVAAAPVMMDARAEAQFMASGRSAPRLRRARISPMPGGCRQKPRTPLAAMPSPARSTSSWSPSSRSTAPTTPATRCCSTWRACASPRRRSATVVGGARGAGRHGGDPRRGPAARVSRLAPTPHRRGRRPLRSARHDGPAARDLHAESTTVVRTFTDGDVIIVVMLEVQPYEQLAAAELGAIGGIDFDRSGDDPGRGSNRGRGDVPDRTRHSSASPSAAATTS